MIINITGPNGSGKSTLVKKLLAESNAVEELIGSRIKVQGYYAKIGKRTIGIVGRYETACGGCDTISSQREVRKLIEKFANTCDHVVFEGVIVSTCFGTYLKFLQKLGKPFKFFILLPTPEVCIKRVKARRRARGADDKFNETNLRNKWSYIKRVSERCFAEGIPHFTWKTRDSAYETLKEMLK